MIVFHGDHDSVVHPVNADRIVDQALVMDRVQPEDVEATRHQRTASDGSGERRSTRVIHRDVSGRALVEQWTIHHGGHAWAGGDPHGSYTDPDGPDASAELVRFFHDSRR